MPPRTKKLKKHFWQFLAILGKNLILKRKAHEICSVKIVKIAYFLKFKFSIVPGKDR